MRMIHTHTEISIYTNVCMSNQTKQWSTALRELALINPSGSEMIQEVTNSDIETLNLEIDYATAWDNIPLQIIKSSRVI